MIKERQEELNAFCNETFGDEWAQSVDDTEAEPVDELVLDRVAVPPADKLETLLEDDDFKKTWNHDRPDFSSMSEYDQSLTSRAKRAGWSDQEIANLIIAFRRKHGDSKDQKKALRKDYVPRTIAKAKVDSEQKAKWIVPQGFSARDLVAMELPALKFAIPSLVPEGLTLMAGKPKAGKSWLALQFVYSVALGKNLLDESHIEQGRALVLGLEDGVRRLRSRVNKINSSDVFIQWRRSETGGVHITGKLGNIEVPEKLDIFHTWPTIGSGGIETLEEYIDEHPDIRLVVIDTIKRFVKKKGKGTPYDEDYDSVQPLQELAIKHGLPILAVCHTRKAASDDPLDMVSGTFGLTGAVYNILVLQREGGDEFRLSIIGRDIESRELAVMFGDRCMWKLLGDADDYFMSEERENILGCLMDNGPMKPSEIASFIGKNSNTTRNMLAKMLRDGQVKKGTDGKYSTGRVKGV